jgi:hypothetical protein
MDEPLEWMEAAWLEEHLDDCAECRAVSAEYAAQRTELRALRPPVPPRDLRARFAAALDEEDARRPRRAVRPAARRRPGWSPFGAVGAVVAAFAVAFLIGSQLVGPSTVPQIAIASAPGSAPASLRLETPIAVEPGPVAWCSQENGSCVIRQAQVDRVCPQGSTSNCVPLDEQSKSIGTLSVTPKSIVSSPDRRQVVVVGTKAGTASTTIYVVPVSGGTSATPTVPPATATPTATSSPFSSPGAVSPSPGESLVPSGTPAPTALAILAIASNVVVVGQSAAYSPDGTWFAFSARPVGRQGGPDIYAWRAGGQAAIPLTTDHQSVFAGWVGKWIVGSRANPVSGVDAASPSAGPADGAGGKPGPKESKGPRASGTPAASEAPEATAAASAIPAGQVATSSFLIDPATRVLTTLPVPVWRPIVDPLGRWVVYWQGTIATDAVGERWVMGTGRLMLGSWASLEGTQAAASAVPLALSPDLGPIEGADWDARWDETGEHLAVWIGDPHDPKIGHLSLITIDPATGQPDPSGRRLIGRPALVGFSLADGHLAWATPPGQDGQGSRLQVYAWSGPNAGQIDSQPATGDDSVIVVH